MQYRTKKLHLLFLIIFHFSQAIRNPLLNNTNLQGGDIFTALGDRQEFYCYTDGDPFLKITWRKDGEEFDVLNMSGIEVTEANQKVTIERVLQKDAGFYECLVESEGGQVTANATLHIFKDTIQAAYDVMATVDYAVNGFVSTSCVPQYINYLRAYYGSLNDVLSARCSAMNVKMDITFHNTSVKLKGDNEVVIVYTVRIDPVVRQTILYDLCGSTLGLIFDINVPSASVIIKPIWNISSDSLRPLCPGLRAIRSSVTRGFSCEDGDVLNLIGEGQVPRCLRTILPPIRNPLLNKTNLRGMDILAAPGSRQEFYCYDSGDPFATVTWMKDGKTFNATDTPRVEITERNQKVTIKRVLEKDAGFYQCIVNNRGEQTTANATLHISNDTIQAAYEVMATIDYGVDGFVSTSCFPQYINYLRTYYGSLNDVLSERCSAMNVKMDITFHNTSVKLKGDNEVVIVYTVRIYPVVHQTLLYDFCGSTLDLIFDLNTPSISAIIEPILNISSDSLPPQCPGLQAIRSSVTRGFSCEDGEVLNLVGEGQVPRCLRTILPPIRNPLLNKTNLRGMDILAAPGSRQEFYCYDSGDPFATVTWMKDGKTFNATDTPRVEITERNQKVTIKRVLEKDAGFYQCIVNNRGEQTTANATLRISNGVKDNLEDTLTVGQTIAMAVCGVLGAVLILVCCYFVKRHLNKKKQKRELDFMSDNAFRRGTLDMFNPDLPPEGQTDLLPYKDKWEFTRERLKLGKTLGQGVFGRVVKAEAVGIVPGEASTTVAVKMLKRGADSEQRKALEGELKILIYIGKHLNIVNLMGAVTKNLAKGELYVIVEHCCFGNLRQFLLKHKATFIDQLDHGTGELDNRISIHPGCSYSNMPDNMDKYSNILAIGMEKNPSVKYADIAHDEITKDTGVRSSVSTNTSCSTSRDRCLKKSFSLSPIDCENEVREEESESSFITTCDLLSFAFQCARGMEYLASRKLIHRDLAARNVLLAKDYIIKICDFGLAKDCYKYPNYVKKSGGLLPIKWMAIESIRDQVFSSKSDVWSFGILLWEIFTLGGDPYPGLQVNEEFFKKLQRGYRMEKPDLAPDAIYQLTKNCWLDDPNERPDFINVVESIGKLLEAKVRKYYMELNIPYQEMNKELLKDSYIRMSGQNEYANMSGSTLPSPDFVNMKETVRQAENESVPRVPMEEMPMIPLENISEPVEDDRLQKGAELSSREYCDVDNQHALDTTNLHEEISPENCDLDDLESKTPNKVTDINGDSPPVTLSSEINSENATRDIGDDDNGVG